MAADPFTLAYDTIIAEFKKDHKNVVSYNTIHAPKKDTLTNADLPELTLVPERAVVKLGNSSCGTDIQQTYQVMVKTGAQRLNQSAFPVMWNLLKVYQRLVYGNTIDAITWNDRQYVTSMSLGVATFTLGAMERGVFGWSCLWPITLDMSFTDSDLQ